MTRRCAVRFHSARVHSVHSAVMCLFAFLLSEFWMRAYAFHTQSSRARLHPDGRLRDKPWWSLLVPLYPLLIPLGQTRERVVNELGSRFHGLVLVGEFLCPVHCGTVRCGRERSEVRRCVWWWGGGVKDRQRDKSVRPPPDRLGQASSRPGAVRVSRLLGEWERWGERWGPKG